MTSTIQSTNETKTLHFIFSITFLPLNLGITAI